MSTKIATLSPAWSIPGYLEVRDDHLTVNGVDTIELVKEFNSPLFVFSEGRIRDNISRLQRAAGGPGAVPESATTQPTTQTSTEQR